MAALLLCHLFKGLEVEYRKIEHRDDTYLILQYTHADKYLSEDVQSDPSNIAVFASTLLASDTSVRVLGFGPGECRLSTQQFSIMY
jgi:hypothetical protein